MKSDVTVIPSEGTETREHSLAETVMAGVFSKKGVYQHRLRLQGLVEAVDSYLGKRSKCLDQM